jgi:hypothetical protein
MWVEKIPISALPRGERGRRDYKVVKISVIFNKIHCNILGIN